MHDSSENFIVNSQILLLTLFSYIMPNHELTIKASVMMLELLMIL